MNQLSFAVIVAFFPEVHQLTRLCESLKNYVNVIIVDNTPEGNKLPSLDFCTWISNNRNIGIAGAQNIGIREAIRQGAESIFFFDQDSYFFEDFILTLINSLKKIGSGVVAPVCINAATNQEYPSFRLSSIGWPRSVYNSGSKTPVNVDLAISSGSIVSSDVFNLVGLMDESLFIDYVDFEWCARVRKAGLPIIIEPNAIMLHSIGRLNTKSFGLNICIHSSERSYYRMRNSFLLFRYRHIYFLYALYSTFSRVIHYPLECLYSKDPYLHLKMGRRGMYDGILGRREGLQ